MSWWRPGIDRTLRTRRSEQRIKWAAPKRRTRLDAQMDARAQSFDVIFRRDVRYFVPVFQRRYAWERERQWEPFWGDVLEVVEAYVEAAEAGGTAPRGDELPVHFLGAIVVKLVPFGAGQTAHRLDRPRQSRQRAGHLRDAQRSRRSSQRDRSGQEPRFSTPVRRRPSRRAVRANRDRPAASDPGRCPQGSGSARCLDGEWCVDRAGAADRAEQPIDEPIC